MSNHHDAIIIPRGVVVATSCLLGLALTLALVARLTGIGATRLEIPAATETRSLSFIEAPDHTVTITDVALARDIRHLAPGDGGFIRVVMRTMEQKRAAAGIGPSAPYTISRDTAGRATLTDPLTGSVLTLAAFGPGNAAAFAELLNIGR